MAKCSSAWAAPTPAIMLRIFGGGPDEKVNNGRFFARGEWLMRKTCTDMQAIRMSDRLQAAHRTQVWRIVAILSKMFFQSPKFTRVV